jgi:hypothetical protein
LSKEPSQGLRYAEPRELRQPGRIRAIAIFSIILGIVGVGVNALLASAMLGQLLKNWHGIKGVSRPGTQPWLIVSGVEAALSCAFAVYLMVAGTMTLQRPRRGLQLHRWYARLKLPLAVVFAVWVGWAMPIYASSDVIPIVAAGALAFIVSAAYPLYLLDMFRKSADVLDGVR